MNILSDDVKILIRKLAIPASVGTLFQTLYNIVDTYFAGKISPEALSALTKSFPIYFILIASSIGVTVAGTSLIGNSIGEKKFNKASTYFCQLIFFSIILIFFITLIGLNLSDDVFKIMGSTDEVMNLGLDYTNIIFYGSFLFIIVVAMNSLLHAEGDTKTYRNALIISFLLNIFLNPILIFGFLFIPAFGMKGIGIATIIAQLISFIIIFNKVIKSELTKKIKKHLNDRVSDVVISDRLIDSATCLILPQSEPGAQLRKILEASGQSFGTTKPIFEVNKNHKLLKKLKDLKGKQFNSFVDFLYDYALIAEGGSPKDPAKYLRQLDKYLS